MNPTPPPPDTDPQLDALLDQALDAGDVPADLQGRILALTDPAMNTLLDEALAPHEAPAGLETRILAKLDLDTAGAEHDAPSVLATIGPRRAWGGYAAAAAIVLATGLVFYFTMGPATNTDTIAVDPDAAEIVAAEESLASLETDTELDTEIDTLQDRILNVSDEPIWGGDDDFQRELWQELAPDDESIAMLF
ncbi:hypothetical protein OT109_11350 [Phycisphaeraceae bacterium D3-23]